MSSAVCDDCKAICKECFFCNSGESCIECDVLLYTCPSCYRSLCESCEVECSQCEDFFCEPCLSECCKRCPTCVCLCKKQKINDKEQKISEDAESDTENFEGDADEGDEISCSEDHLCVHEVDEMLGLRNMCSNSKFLPFQRLADKMTKEYNNCSKKKKTAH